MPFLGAAINLVRGGIKKIDNINKISKLEDELNKSIYEGMSEEEKIDARIKVLQVNLELAKINKDGRERESHIEKEIINLMDMKLKKKMDELRKKEATQLDVANALITIQKSNNEVKDYLSEVESNISKLSEDNYKKVQDMGKKIKEENYNSLRNVHKDINQKGNERIIEISEKTIDEVKKLSKIVQENDTMVKMNNKLTGDISQSQNSIKEKIDILKINIENANSMSKKNDERINQLNQVATLLREDIQNNKREILNVRNDISILVDRANESRDNINVNNKAIKKLKRYLIGSVSALAIGIIGIAIYFSLH
ncbi:hypothetical protein [Oceanirhabdus seepicola]|uniref:Uncharacterized protein n=1 Tax=Oceanirhabdus seepicola TaxID=2828781 RepID=A0A9J6NY19_9CLOT|nr:hypothetical protein [Oceanirhabdus seepicola]MCM1988793.1 hypothetical protein [Oceanirhabdus seepicola]